MKKLFYCLYCIFLCIVYTSCSNEESINPKIQTETDSNFVKKNEAYAIATMLKFDLEQDSSQVRSSSYLDVESIVPLGKGDKPTYYIVNYTNNSGFVIIAADKRVNSVLAFSTESGFKLDNENMPGGLLEWMQETDSYITEVRESNVQSPAITTRSMMCNALSSVKLRAANDGACFDYNGSNCPPEYQKTETVLPLLKTEWHQMKGFNDLVPKECGSGKAPAGCVAIAMAQVMYYHKYPSFYNWAQMDPIFGGIEASRLIRDLGVKSALDMKYRCGGSGTETEKAKSVFSQFLYRSSSFGSFNSKTVQNQLRNKLPVILSGSKSSSWSFLGFHANGHAWVCDGFMKFNNCTYTTLSFHMNWGWGSIRNTGNRYNYNGWYGVSDWNSPVNNYNKENKMVYNIKP